MLRAEKSQALKESVSELMEEMRKRDGVEE
jgi:hypothetical protein